MRLFQVIDRCSFITRFLAENAQTMVQINATTQDRDLGAVARDIRRVIEAAAADVPKGSRVVLLGQVLELRARASTNGAIKELLKLAPREALRVDADGRDEDAARRPQAGLVA